MGNTEQINTQDALREIQARLVGIVESAMDAIITVDENQTILLFNRAAEKMFLCSSSQALGQTLDCFIPQRFRSAHIQHIQTFGKTGISNRGMAVARAIYGLRFDGEEFPVEASISQVESAGRKFFTVIMRDITERVRAEENQAKLAAIVESSNDAIISKKFDGKILSWNRGAEKIFGYSAKEIIGENILTLFPSDKFNEENEIIQKIKRNERIQAFETVRLNKNKQPILVSLSYSPIKNREGEVIAVSIIAQDITEQKTTQIALKESQARFSQLVESSIIGIIIAKLDGTVLESNDVFLEMLGFERKDILLRKLNLRENTPTEFQIEDERAIAEIKKTSSVNPREKAYIRKDGSIIPVLVGGKLLEGSNDTVIAFVLDISEQKRVSEELKSLNETLERRVIERTEQLEAVNKELEAFSYTVSHDLRAPLRHINGFSQALLEDYSDRLDDTGKGFLNEVRNASQEMAQLIDDVLRLARVTRSEIQKEKVNLSDLAEKILDDLKKLDSHRKVTINIEKELIVYGDKRLLKIMLDNLLGNAWKFTSKNENARIEFGCDQSSSEKTYFVRDNGAGFEMAYIDKLFGVFQRLHTNEEFEGTGIGLATVQRIISRHGGNVWAVGEKNKGAVIYFNFRD